MSFYFTYHKATLPAVPKSRVAYCTLNALNTLQVIEVVG